VAERLLQAYTHLQPLARIGEFLAYYHNGTFHPPANPSEAPTAIPTRISATHPQQHGDLESMITKSTHIKKEVD
jgi:hypothetical protein